MGGCVDVCTPRVQGCGPARKGRACVTIASLRPPTADAWVDSTKRARSALPLHANCHAPDPRRAEGGDAALHVQLHAHAAWRGTSAEGRGVCGVSREGKQGGEKCVCGDVNVPPPGCVCAAGTRSLVTAVGTVHPKPRAQQTRPIRRPPLKARGAHCTTHRGPRQPPRYMNPVVSPFACRPPAQRTTKGVGLRMVRGVLCVCAISEGG